MHYRIHKIRQVSAAKNNLRFNKVTAKRRQEQKPKNMQLNQARSGAKSFMGNGASWRWDLKEEREGCHRYTLWNKEGLFVISVFGQGQGQSHLFVIHLNKIRFHWLPRNLDLRPRSSPCKFGTPELCSGSITICAS